MVTGKGERGGGGNEPRAKDSNRSTDDRKYEKSRNTHSTSCVGVELEQAIGREIGRDDVIFIPKTTNDTLALAHY